MRGKKGNRLPRGKMKAILIVSAIVVLALVSRGIRALRTVLGASRHSYTNAGRD